MAYQVKISTFKDGRPIAVKKSYVPGVLRLNEPLESIAIQNFPLQFPGKMYFARRSIYLFTCKILETGTGWCSAEPAKSAKTISTRKQKIQIFGAKTVRISNFSSKYKVSRGGFEAEHQTHNLKVAGSIPAISLVFMITDFYQKVKGWKMFFFFLS